NFIGITELGGRQIHVKSKRLESDEVARMLDDVVTRLAALVYTRDTPTGFGYARTDISDNDVLHHAYIFIRHALEGVGPADLRPAMDRILTRPLRQLLAVGGET